MFNKKIATQKTRSKEHYFSDYDLPTYCIKKIHYEIKLKKLREICSLSIKVFAKIHETGISIPNYFVIFFFQSYKLGDVKNNEVMTV